MSAKISGLVWELDLPREEKYVLLCLADHANHDGGDVFPSIGLVAWKTGYSERRIQELMRHLEHRRLLVRVEERIGRGKTTKYRIDVNAGLFKRPRTKGASVSPISGHMSFSKGAVSPVQKGAPGGTKGEIAAAPESKEPNTLNQSPHSPKGGLNLTSRDHRIFFKELNRIYAASQGSSVNEEDAIRRACTITGTPLATGKAWVALSYGEET